MGDGHPSGGAPLGGGLLGFGEDLLFKTTADATPGIDAFTRASVGHENRSGVLHSIGSGILRRRNTVLANDGNSYRTLLLEGARTNLVLQAEDLTDAAWTDIGTPTEGATHTSTGVTLLLLGDDAAGAAEGKSQVISFTGDAVKAVSLFIKKGSTPPGNGSEIIIRDTTAAADRLQATVTWAGTVPSSTMTTGTEIRDPELISDGVYRLHYQTTAVTAANNNQIELYPGRKAVVADTGDVYFGGIMAEDGPSPSSFITTAAATASRAADSLYYDFFARPQAMTVYIKFVERGSILMTGGVFYIGGAAVGADPRLQLNSDGNAYSLRHDNGTDNVVSTMAPAQQPSIDDTVELRCLLYSDGSIDIAQSVNGATEVASNTGRSAVAPLYPAWNAPRLWLNSLGATYAGFNSFIAVKVCAGVQTMNHMRAL
jgi:hypothetical protein